MKLNKRASLIAKASFCLTAMLISACSHVSEDSPKQKRLIDFSEKVDLKQIVPLSASVSYTDLDGGAAQIDLHAASNHIAGFTIQPDKPWNFSDFKALALTLDIANPTDESVSMYVSTSDQSGDFQMRSVVVPANSKQRYSIDIDVPELAVETGVRSNPESWVNSYQALIWRGGEKQLDTSAITAIRFDVRGALHDKTLIVDNVTAIEPLEFKDDYLKSLVDSFGQNAKMDFAQKIDSVEQLRSVSDAEQQQLQSGPLTDRSRYHGWRDGPKLEATGFYRTEKYQGQWSLVDPEGYLFFSNGIANVRMANTSTMTGYDFDHKLIHERSSNDFTPEDSLGLNRVPDQALSSRHVSSKLRADMFTWLPDYQDPLGKHFGYRREVHSGAMERGETYSFYRANLARKYRTHDTATLMQQWRDTTVKRMENWGFTSFGNWVDPAFYEMKNYPYFANGWIIGDFKTVSSGNDYWGALPDPFDPAFTERAYATVKKISEEVANSPWCVGVFIDNEKSWGIMGSVESQYGVVLNTLTRKASDSPTKAAFAAYLKQQYGSIDELNNAWGTQVASWKILEEGIVLNRYTDAALADMAAMLELYTAEYFRIVDAAMDELMPNHLYLGARFADWAMTPEVRQAAAPYVDVMSYNYYREAVSDVFWDFLAELDMPSIIGEFHNGALDSGLLNPGLIHAESQYDRGVKYQEYVNSVIDNPYFVGVHWFQYIDSPLTGRAYDGENYNVGFVSVTDIPYKPLVDAARAVNRSLYKRRYD
ncbi:beta-galactosidase [Gilvimarinus agarilyticus]|uniref:beta-galactosidase n=1 Tax=Gilvimarinus agarilyticus TaxID=679259 RepID=UPI000698D21C|nr:beta-galactosidase [Gilvimarinus agarilyticus]